MAFKGCFGISIETIVTVIGIFDLVFGIFGGLTISNDFYHIHAPYLIAPVIISTLTITAAVMLLIGLEKERVEYVKVWILAKIPVFVLLILYPILGLLDVIWFPDIYQMYMLAGVLLILYAFFVYVVGSIYYKSLIKPFVAVHTIDSRTLNSK